MFTPMAKLGAATTPSLARVAVSRTPPSASCHPVVPMTIGVRVIDSRWTVRGTARELEKSIATSASGHAVSSSAFLLSMTPTTAKPASGASDRAKIPQGSLDSDAEMLLNALGFEPTDLDRLVERTGLSTRSVLSKLQLLELEGRVETLAGGRYSRTTARQAR